MIARAIAKIANVPDNNITKYALEHDLDEIRTGDIPTPAKKILGIDPPHGGKTVVTDVERQIVKAADTIEALWFIEESGVGRHAKGVQGYIEDRFAEFCKSVPSELKVPILEVMQKIWHGEFEVL